MTNSSAEIQTSNDGHRRHELRSKSPVIKRSLMVSGHKTSVSLEDQFWTALKEIAIEKNLTVENLVSKIDWGAIIQTYRRLCDYLY